MEYNHYKYVIKYFELKYCTYFNHFSEEHKKKMCMEISQKVRNKFNSLKDVLDGKADDYIMSMINGTVNIVRPKLRTDYLNLRNYIIKYINENDFVNYDEKTLYVIVEQICTDLMPVYSQTRIIEGKLDEDILRCYEKNLKLLAEKIRRYVTKYISENIVPIDGVNNVEVENEILRLIMNTNDINAFDFLIGRCDEKIRDVAEKNREDNINKRRAELPDTFKYIKNLIEIYSEDDIKLVDECVSKVDIRLRDQGLTSKEIVSGKYDIR